MRAQIFNASAGSGKTYRLAYKYVRDVIWEPLRYRHILAVTFTNKATEEMKSRILREIDTLASGGKSPYLEELMAELNLSEDKIRRNALSARGNILHDYSRFTVLTIDTFFQRILRAFIQELGLDLNYNIEIESSSVLEQSADSLIEQITSDDELRRWLLEFIEERVEDGKRWDIHDGILSLSRELLNESNRETLQNGLSKEHIKEIVSSATVRSKASREEYKLLGQRGVDIISNAGCEPSDFAGKSRSFAYIFERVASGEIKPPTKTAEDRSQTTEGWCTKGSPAQAIVGELQPLLAQICAHYYRDIKLWNTTTLVRENFRSFALLSDLYARLKQICDEQSMMLLSETKLILAEFIKDNDAPFIYEKSGNRYERFMIDEFQDTSLKEWQNFLPLLQNAMSQSEDSTVLIVGDIKQSIYRWRGGDWRILHSGALEALGCDSTEVVTLQDNFRSLPLIVEFNNSIIEEVVECENSFLNSMIDGAVEGGYIDLESKVELTNMLKKGYENHAQNPRKGASMQGYVEVSTFVEEPPIIDAIIEVLDRGFSPSDIMILGRSNTDGVKVANMLLEFKEHNKDPKYRFDIMTQEALIVGNAPVSCFVVANMKLALNESDPTQLAIYNNFLGRDNFDQPLGDEELQIFRIMRLKSLEEVFEQIVMYHRLDLRKENIAYLQALHEQLIAFSSTRIGDISLFVKWWEEHGSRKSLSVERSDSAIEITTIHKAKGLEKRVVIIPYCNWSLNPKTSGESANIVWAEGGDEVAELGRFPVRFKSAMGESRFSKEYFREMVYSHIDNVNLLYVALTRAVESLHIFVPRRPIKSKRTLTNTKIGDVLLYPLEGDADEVQLGHSLVGKVTDYGDSKTIIFGEPSSPATKTPIKSDGELYIMDRYPTAKCDLRLRLPSQRYTQDSEGGVDPRHIGVLMHKTFEEATSRDDIFARLDLMKLNGQLSSQEFEALRSGVEEVLNNPLVEEWFSGDWDDVRNENDIIVPQNSEIRRPDRVMIRGAKAVVVDYKFGGGKHSSYQRQVRGYMELLLQMGYTQVEGYLWYIKSGEIVRV
ncbi:MAG: UvrD-helicase domain-containing protein [Rikenellaceae bacterium]